MLALMTGTAMIAVGWPLLRKAGDLRAGSDIAVYRDQLHEIRRDQQLGWIGSSEAEAAQIREHSAIWHQQLEKLRSRLTGLTIEPPTRMQ